MEMVSTHSKALYAIGEVPVSRRPDTDFLIVQASHMTDLAAQADVVFPSAAPLESEGTIVDHLGRLREVKKAVEPSGEARSNSDILVAVAKAMGSALKPVRDTDVKKALKIKSRVAFSPFKRDKNLEVDAGKFTEEINKSAINGSRLLWLKEIEKTVAA
jgi:predicted molibdopterin-dependent oxidoreductase YjgC